MNTTTIPRPEQSTQLFAAYVRAAQNQQLIDALAAVSITFLIRHEDASAVVFFGAPDLDGSGNEEQSVTPVVTIEFSSTACAAQFWTGQVAMATALTDGHLRIYGPVNRILELVGALPLLFAALAG